MIDNQINLNNDPADNFNADKDEVQNNPFN